MAWRHLPAPYQALAAGCLNCGRSNLGWSPNTRVRPGGGHLPTSSLAMPSNTRFPLPGISLGSTRSRQEVGGRNRRSGGAHHFRGAGRSMRNKWASARQSASGVPRHNASEFRRPRCRASQNAGGRIAGRNAWRANSGRAESGASDRSKPPHSRRSSLGTGPPRDHWDGTVGGIWTGPRRPIPAADSGRFFKNPNPHVREESAGSVTRVPLMQPVLLGDFRAFSQPWSSFREQNLTVQGNRCQTTMEILQRVSEVLSVAFRSWSRIPNQWCLLPVIWRGAPETRLPSPIWVCSIQSWPNRSHSERATDDL